MIQTFKSKCDRFIYEFDPRQVFDRNIGVHMRALIKIIDNNNPPRFWNHSFRRKDILSLNFLDNKLRFERFLSNETLVCVGNIGGDGPTIVISDENWEVIKNALDL